MHMYKLWHYFFTSHLRLEVLNVEAFLQYLLYMFNGVGQAVLRQQGIEDLHRLLVPSTIVLIFLPGGWKEGPG